MKTLELENAINLAVNALHQYGDELSGLLDGRLDLPCKKHVRAARSAGIAIQSATVADRLLRTFNRAMAKRD